MKTFIKKKAGPNQSGPGFRTSDHFRASKFGGGGKTPAPSFKFNPSQFRVQHKG